MRYRVTSFEQIKRIHECLSKAKIISKRNKLHISGERNGVFISFNADGKRSLAEKILVEELRK